MSRRLKIQPPVLGIRNRTVATEITKGGVIDAVNVDISDGGSIRRRGAPVLISPLLGIRKAFYSEAHQQLYFVAEQYLYRASPTALSSPTLLRALGGVGLGGAFTEHNGYVYYSGGNALYQIDAEGEVLTAIPTPLGTPTLSTIPGGDLPPGTYHIVCTTVDPITKREGGTSPQISVTVGVGESIVVNLLPLDPPQAFYTNVYITPIGSEVFYLAHTVPYGLNTVISKPPSGKRCMTLNESPLRGGDKLCWAAGRLFTVVSKWRLGVQSDSIGYSTPFNPLLTRAAYNYFVLSGACRLLNRAGSVLYVGDDRGVWAVDANNIEDTKWSLVSPHLAISGSGLTLEGGELPLLNDIPTDAECAIWLSPIGVMVGLPDGSVRNVTSNVALNKDALVSFVGAVTQFGTKQVIFSSDVKVTL